MPTVTCPNCGERGKITPNLIGSRIKCRKCSISFTVSAPVAKGVPAAASTSAPALSAPAMPTHEGIEVEGLDASTWSLSTETGSTLHAEARPDHGHADPAASSDTGFAAAPVDSRQYKMLTSRDKYFDGKFDLNRLEEAINHFARQGWTVKAMTLPHVKGYSGALEETIVVLLEK